MDPIQTPMSKEEKEAFEKRTGLMPYTPVRVSPYCDPNDSRYHLFNLPILAASIAGYLYAPKIALPRLPFTISLVLMPVFYLVSVHHNEKRFELGSGPRKTLEQHLEFYPITRRAWNRAVAIREKELEEQNSSTS